MKRLAVAAAASAIAATASLVGAGQASAAPIPHFPASTSFGTFGDHSFCHGVLRVDVDAPPKKRGVVRVTVTSLGFTGIGATWKRNPNCRMRINTLYNGSAGFGREKWVTASFGPRRGEKKVWEVATGSGPASIGLTTYSVNSPVRVRQGYNGGAYVLVP
ncbi:enoyl-CoA hydratase [Gordonia sp. C13]|nr:enoyl-CoA hydratase [Gordonia sp. C13]